MSTYSSDSQQLSPALDPVERGVMAMHRQGEPNEVIAMAFGLPVLQVRHMIAQQARGLDAAVESSIAMEDDPAPIVRRVPRKSRHPDRCKHCGAMLTIKPCIACYAQAHKL